MALAWAAYGTVTASVVAVVALLGAALFRQINRVEVLGDRIGDLRGAMIEGFAAVDRRFDGLEGRFDGLEVRMGGLDARGRTDKQEILDRLDVIATRLSRLEDAA